MIYLIGGAPRVGKTKLVEKAISSHNMHAISSDAIRYMLRRTVSKSVLAPELFWSHEEFIERRDYTALLRHQNAESDSLWPFLVRIMESYSDDGYDLLVEGVAVLPSLVHKLELPCKVILVGNSSEHHADVITSQAAANTHDWLHKYSPEQVAIYCTFFREMSDWFESEAVRYDMPYFSINDDTFDADIAHAAKALVG